MHKCDECGTEEIKIKANQINFNLGLYALCGAFVNSIKEALFWDKREKCFSNSIKIVNLLHIKGMLTNLFIQINDQKRL